MDLSVRAEGGSVFLVSLGGSEEVAVGEYCILSPLLDQAYQVVAAMAGVGLAERPISFIEFHQISTSVSSSLHLRCTRICTFLYSMGYQRKPNPVLILCTILSHAKLLPCIKQPPIRPLLLFISGSGRSCWQNHKRQHKSLYLWLPDHLRSN